MTDKFIKHLEFPKQLLQFIFKLFFSCTGSQQLKELSDQIEQQEGIIEANKSLIEKVCGNH